ncbi:MAG: hypothetical protein ATN36_01925 [Epulopiscium sp. Nele67-Bin005]|nr:MAG: hypothetical protein ATN36_01925 [Epulopiscium sp. Nele67-Bin005]
MLDLLVLIFIIFTTYWSYSKGFIITIYQFGVIIASLVISVLLYPIIAQLLQATPIAPSINEMLIGYLAGLEVVEGLQSQANVINEYLDFVPSFIQNTIIQNNNPEVYKILNVTGVVEYVAQVLTNFVIDALALLITLISVRTGLGFTGKAVDAISKLPVINAVNKGAGFALGFAKAIIIVWIGCLALPFLMMIPQFEWLQEAWEYSELTKFLYENNLLLDYISRMIIG